MATHPYRHYNAVNRSSDCQGGGTTKGSPQPVCQNSHRSYLRRPPRCTPPTHQHLPQLLQRCNNPHTSSRISGTSEGSTKNQYTNQPWGTSDGGTAPADTHPNIEGWKHNNLCNDSEYVRHDAHRRSNFTGTAES